MSTVNRDIRLRVLANVRQFTKDMETIPGTTQKQAAAAGRKMVATFAAAERQRLADARKAAAARERLEREEAARTKQLADQQAAQWKAVGTAIVAALSVASVRAVGDMISEVQGLRTELDELSTTSGLATETLAGIDAAARRNNKSLSDFREVLNPLPKRMAEAALGTGEAIRGFDGLGVSVTDANGKLRSSDDVLREVLRNLQAIDDPTQRAALATQALGEQGAKLLQVLGGTELEDFVAYATEYGQDVGPDAIAAARDWTAAQAELSDELRAIKADLVDTIASTRQLEGFTTGLAAAYHWTKTAVREVADEFLSWDAILKTTLSAGIWNLSVFVDAVETAGSETAAFLEERHRLRTQLQGDDDTLEGVAEATRQLAEQEREAEQRAQAWRKEQEKLRRELEQMLSGQERLYAVIDQAESDIRGEIARTNIEYQDRITEVHRLADATHELAQTEMDRIAIREAEAQAVDALIERREREINLLLKQREITKEELVARQLAAQAAEDEALRLDKIKRAAEEAYAAKQQMTANEQVFQAALQGTAQIVGEIPGLFKRGSREAALAQKRTAQAQAVINAYLAASAALTIPAPPPIPQISAAANLAAGFAQVAAIESTPIPSNATGGVVPPSAPLAYGNGFDERLVTARPGEVIFTPEQIDALGGGGGPTYVTAELRFENRVLGRQLMVAERRGRQVSRAIGMGGLRQRRDRRVG